MGSLQPTLEALLKALPPPPTSQESIQKHVAIAIEEASEIKMSPDVKKSQWENVLKRQMFKLARTEGHALKDENTKYYDDLKMHLDVALEFANQEACDQSFVFLLLQDLLETQTIASCSHIFSWLELRAPQLTKDMMPQKGKALVLLRTLNDLLRRLSKMGSNTTFCGRILTFLSGVFPLGERSGVNLRGEYGPTWEGVQSSSRPSKPLEEDKTADSPSKAEPEKEENKDKMDVDDTEAARELQKKSEEDNFYNVFWSLQLPFSKPPIFAVAGTFAAFQEGVNKVLPVIKEHTTKERIMMGSRASGSGASNTLKRKRDMSEGEEPAKVTEYFFAKFLTSPDLLGLELKDTHFRRQILFQLIVLLNHLLTFTKEARETWTTSRNRSLIMDFTLEPAEAQWVQDTITKVVDEIRQTTPDGRTFADTVQVILERERNWVLWKCDNCPPFDKAPWTSEVNGKKVGLYEATKPLLDRMKEPPEPWKWTYGSENLTEVWMMGYRGLSDLENFSPPDSVQGFWEAIKRENNLIELRKKKLQKMAEQRAASARAQLDTEVAAETKKANTSDPSTHQSEASSDAAPTQEPAASSAMSAPKPVQAQTANDPVILKHEENKQRLSWLALRAARDQHVSLFGKIGTGDVELLMKGIEGTLVVPAAQPSAAASPLVTPSVLNAVKDDTREKGVDNDVKMESRTQSPIPNGDEEVAEEPGTGEKPQPELDVKMADIQ